MLAIDADYGVHLGTFVMNGPKPENHTCPFGSPCSLTIYGTGLSSNNFLHLLEMTRACGEDVDPRQDYGSIFHPANVRPSDLDDAATRI